jgi:hypothetical protein
MYEILDRLLAFIQPVAEQWDMHQIHLEHVTAQLLDMMREYRRPHDLQNEVKYIQSGQGELMKIFVLFL